MSVYRPKGSETYVYDFQWRGRRFSGATGAKSKREAQQVERTRRDAVRREGEAQATRENRPMTLDDACGRYWSEVGQHQRRPDGLEWSIDYLLKHLGVDKPLAEITDDDIARMVAKRRSDRVDNVMVRRSLAKGRSAKEAKRVSAATVNRSVIEPLRRLMLRARDTWGKDIGRIAWNKHKLKEPKERIRSLSADEERKLFEHLPADYHALARFALRTGCRAMECVNLRWSDIDWGNRRVAILGKGNKLATIPLSLDMRDLLFPLQGNGSEFVFLIAPRARRDGDVEPMRHITYRGYYSAFLRACRAAGIGNLRIHDLRHTAATRLVARTGNLKMAQKLLRHEDIGTTAKYAAVLDDDLRNALDAMLEQEVPGKVPNAQAKTLRSKA